MESGFEETNKKIDKLDYEERIKEFEEQVKTLEEQLKHIQNP